MSSLGKLTGQKDYSFPRTWGNGEMGVTANAHRASFGKMKIFWNYIILMVTQL